MSERSPFVQRALIGEEKNAVGPRRTVDLPQHVAGARIDEDRSGSALAIVTGSRKASDTCREALMPVIYRSRQASLRQYGKAIWRRHQAAVRWLRFNPTR